jgi:hypothetical protein
VKLALCSVWPRLRGCCAFHQTQRCALRSPHLGRSASAPDSSERTAHWTKMRRFFACPSRKHRSCIELQFHTYTVASRTMTKIGFGGLHQSIWQRDTRSENQLPGRQGVQRRNHRRARATRNTAAEKTGLYQHRSPRRQRPYRLAQARPIRQGDSHSGASTQLGEILAG